MKLLDGIIVIYYYLENAYETLTINNKSYRRRSNVSMFTVRIEWKRNKIQFQKKNMKIVNTHIPHSLCSSIGWYLDDLNFFFAIQLGAVVIVVYSPISHICNIQMSL